MKQAILILVLLLTTFCFGAEEKVTITIDGMTCGSCVQKITQALTDIDGVKTADVTLKPGSATVVYEGDKTDSDRLLKAITIAGYKPALKARAASEANIAVDAKPATAAKKGCSKACAKTCSPKVQSQCGVTATARPSTAASVKAAGMTEAHACPTDLRCKELNDFHSLMHPMHMALQNADFETIRANYPLLAQKAEALKTLDCSGTCNVDKKKFDKNRKNLIKRVDKLGEAVRGDNDKKLMQDFDKMHEAYVELGNLCNGEHH